MAYDLPPTVASNMVKVSHALNHSATGRHTGGQLYYLTYTGLVRSVITEENNINQFSRSKMRGQGIIKKSRPLNLK